MNQQIRNLLIALTAVVLGVVLFLGVQQQSQTPSLSALAESSIPIDVAVANGKPTLVEFYADWCTSCRAMTGDMAALKQEFGSDLNFVMLNVDNSKWVPELLKYQVDGIPHFVFMNGGAQEVGMAVGEVPKPIMQGNLKALVHHQTLPYVGGVGTASPLEQGGTSAATQSDPRSHGAQVKS
ncbi:MAG: thioredoxin fold domain-containing protein [Acaryochloridaceae cyanobacterium RL_2_7]|nr:thioredoxin fold domain-containing protein [Acaryochloridaceae cyanobacterium RL_2_7]